MTRHWNGAPPASKPLLAHRQKLLLAAAAQRVGVEIAELDQRLGHDFADEIDSLLGGPVSAEVVLPPSLWSTRSSSSCELDGPRLPAMPSSTKL